VSAGLVWCVCDVVEFMASTEGVKLSNRTGLYLPAPVEYKRDPVDEAQPCAQARSLEEMRTTSIPSGYLYDGQTCHFERSISLLPCEH
jgi:CRISPR-associated exonuclease Cas4